MTRTMALKGIQTRILMTVAVLAISSISAMAQVEHASQINLQGTGLVVKDTDSGPMSQHTTKSGGLLVGYSYQFAKWAGVEGNYGYTQNTVNTYGSFGQSSIRSDFHEVTGSFVAHIPVNVRQMRPYALAGGGALVFRPTDDAKTTNSGIDQQTKAAFVYGGGVNFDIVRQFGIRAEYRGLVYKTPDFGMTSLNLDKITHLAQPSVGVYFRF
jgi:outer membrane immunogenic protein